MKHQAVLFAVGLSAAAAHAQFAQSTFDTSAEGWTYADVDPRTHVSGLPAGSAIPWDGANGLPPGSIRAADVVTWCWARAPQAFRGNFTGAYGLALEWDAFARLIDTGSTPILAIAGANKTLYYNVDLGTFALNRWVQFRIPLREGCWVLNDYLNGPPASQADVLEVLADVREVLIDVDIHSGADDNSLDNVGFGAAPCYPDCECSTSPGTLDIFDFLCFQNRFATNHPYACDCDTTSGPGVCDIFDFLCFQNAYDAGCP